MIQYEITPFENFMERAYLYDPNFYLNANCALH